MAVWRSEAVRGVGTVIAVRSWIERGLAVLMGLALLAYAPLRWKASVNARIHGRLILIYLLVKAGQHWAESAGLPIGRVNIAAGFVTAAFYCAWAALLAPAGEYVEPALTINQAEATRPDRDTRGGVASLSSGANRDRRCAIRHLMESR